MVFKLLRIDAEGKKIKLPLGEYFIGKGKLLECDDEQVPFNHGYIIITKYKLAIEPLHQNKLFFTEKGSKKIQVLQKSKKTLKDGDSFGLLRKSYWYEIIHCTSDEEIQATEASYTQDLDVSDTTRTNNEKEQKNDRIGSGMKTSSSESLSSSNEPSNSKRSHSPEEKGKVKRMKRQSASKIGAGGGVAPAQPRERCIYGATCYSLRSLRRRNSEHKAQFAHPRDPDWGEGGALPPCALGAACRRAGALHWQRYSHPPHACRPGPVPRTKANKCWRRHSALSESDSDSPVNSPRVRPRRARKPLPKNEESEPEAEDPYATEGSEDWSPAQSDLEDYYF